MAMDASNDAETTYFGRLRPGDKLSKPSWLMRRVSSPAGTVDELLGLDGLWRPSDMLARTERGELPGTLRPVGALLPGALQATAQKRYREVCRALERQRAGAFPLRLAMPGRAQNYDDLDAEARAEVIGYLTGAPLVTTGPAGTYRTDGMWVWPESIADDVRATGAPPEDQFYYHIRARRFFFPEPVNPDVLERARRLLEMAAASGGAERVEETGVPGQPGPLTEEERQRALGAWHAEWERKHSATTPFRPDRHPDEPDYNVHHVDADASPEADWEYTRRAREIMGLDPETGARTDI